MREDRLSAVAFWLTAFLAAVDLGFGVLHPLIGDWDSDTDRLVFGLLVGGGGVLLVVSLVVFRRSPWRAAVLGGIGAIAGALGLFWTIVIPILAIVLIVLSLLRVRRVGSQQRPGRAARHAG
jgi:uncharacterized membrane protein